MERLTIYRSHTGDHARARSLLLALMLALAPAPRTFAADPGAAPGTPAIRIDEAWIRWLPAGVPAGGYATLTNTGDKTLTLISVSSPYFEDIMIHRTVRRAGTMEMEPVEGIRIEPHSSVRFASMGYHLMLGKPTTPLESIDRVPMTLRFADGSSLTAPFEIRKPGAGQRPP